MIPSDKLVLYQENAISTVVEISSDPLLNKSILMIGNDENPFMCFISPKDNSYVFKDVPLQMKLGLYNSCMALGLNMILIGGGISSTLSVIIREFYLIRIINKDYNFEIKKLPKTIYHRYAYSMIVLDEYLYLIGGRGYH